MNYRHIFIFILSFLFTSASFGLNKVNVNYLNNQDTLKTCFDCHYDVVGKKRKHAPVEESCENCHSATGLNHPGEGKGFQLTDKAPVLCFYCHEESTQKNIHAPVEMGECSACHETHSSNYRSLLNVSRENLCFECHDSDMKKGKSVHVPVEMNACADCHKAHESEYRNLLIADQSTLCFNCHDDVQTEINSKYAHAAAADDCFTCHVSHSSEHEKLLVEQSKNLCFMCHGDIEESTSDSKFVHAVLNDKNACSKCHSPHGSSERGIIRQQEKELCLSCHGRTYKTELGKTENIQQKLKAGNVIHAPAEEGCIICHEPHASNYVSVLKSSFPEGNYAEAIPENFAICFECHDTDLLTSEFSENTGFRHGNKNMHYLHIKGDKGRSCSTCHDSHGANNNFLIKGKVPFGNWEMDMNFVVTENGGSCATGCHAKKEYDRTFKIEEPKKNDLPVIAKGNRYQNYTEHIQEIDSSVIKRNALRKKQRAMEDSLKRIAFAENTYNIDQDSVGQVLINGSEDSLKADLAKEIEADDKSKKEIKHVPITEVIELKEKEYEIAEFQPVLFEFSKYEVSKKSLPTISLVAEYLIRNPRLEIELRGHSDNVGDADFNMELSLLRAKNVKKILENYGVRGDRINVKGLGSTKPLISNATESMRVKNRRVEFIISTKKE